jgi:hypothetical protein
MSAQIDQRFAAIDRRSNGSHRVSLIYNAASNPNPNRIPLLLPQSLLPRSAAPAPTLPRSSTTEEAEARLLAPLGPGRRAGLGGRGSRSPHLHSNTSVRTPSR